MQLLDLMNEVYTRLRHPRLAALPDQDEDPYFANAVRVMNEVRRYVEERWNWASLRDAYTFTIPAAQDVVTLASVGERATITEIRDRARRLSLRRGHSTALRDWEEDPRSGPPTHWAPQSVSNTRELTIRVWPTPTEDTVVQVWGVMRQSDIRPDDANGHIRVPPHLVILGTIAALTSDDGMEGAKRDATFMDALGTAVAAEQALFPGELDLWVGERQ